MTVTPTPIHGIDISEIINKTVNNFGNILINFIKEVPFWFWPLLIIVIVMMIYLKKLKKQEREEKRKKYFSQRYKK